MAHPKEESTSTARLACMCFRRGLKSVQSANVSAGAMQWKRWRRRYRSRRTGCDARAGRGGADHCPLGSDARPRPSRTLVRSRPGDLSDSSSMSSPPQPAASDGPVSTAGGLYTPRVLAFPVAFPPYKRVIEVTSHAEFGCHVIRLRTARLELRTGSSF